MITWSYSGIKTFDQCPKKYYHLRVAKDVADTAGPEAVYGNEVHKAAEDYIKDGTPIPEKYGYMKPVVESLSKIKGEKHTELKMGVKRTPDGFEPCGFFDKDVWYRGIADLVIINGDKARVIDYKTGKNAKYADTKQLDLMAGAIFIHFPEVQKVRAALAYVVSNEFIPRGYQRGLLNEYMGAFELPLARLEVAVETGVWNAKSGPLCGWCPVVSCEHWKPRRK